ncbi:DUF6318 family protein [Ornithinimicrobium sediminis]|uniref:DUF6318 family protein n=1 Tax=Ornithinimicrobium sediminis TaxID=2904603 RepID=UPI001E40CA3A|nr:DUF6318 family protein [Ornithinimicrobium sediminis]
MRLITATAVGLALLTTTACSSAPQPAAPPTPTDSVSATSAAPPEDTAPETATETASPPTDALPELPDEAKEQTEAGAEAFVLHYVEIINFTGMSPQEGLLEELATDTCSSCGNYEDTVVYSAQDGQALRARMWRVSDSNALLLEAGASAIVRASIDQAAQPVYDGSGDVVSELNAESASLAFSLVWDQGWLIDEIQVEA